MIKKIENYINNGDYNRAAELIKRELEKSFDFKNKKDQKKYMDLNNSKIKLSKKLKAIRKRKKVKGKGAFVGSYRAGDVVKYLLGIDIPKATRVPKRISENELLKRKFNDLVLIAKTKNEHYRNQLLYLANVIDEEEQTILICGETGVGKTFLAAQIHHLSSRSKKNFVAINCGRLSKSDIYANLFGAKKGTYTGGTTENLGKIAKAQGGTLFLDEIDKAPQDVRYSLLTFIETKTYNRYGENEDFEADVRIIFGTNKDLKELVRKEEFEEDIYYRITKRLFHIPPLRKRKEDIPLVIKWALDKFNSQKGINIKIDNAAIELLSQYPWYGNFRELEDYMNRILSDIYLWVDTITLDVINDNPPEKYPLKSINQLHNIETIIKNNLIVWDSNSGKYLSDFIEPVVAKIYMDDYNPQMKQSQKYDQAMNILGISGNQRKKSTLYKKYLEYEEIKKKFS